MKKDIDGNEYSEGITKWEKLTGRCSTCNSPAVVIRVHSVRKYKSRHIISGGQMHDYCAEHSPIDIAAEEAALMKILQTPPGLT